MANIKRISPNWLRIVMLPSDSIGKRNPETSGDRCPKTEGPSTIPATISPITVGCPIFWNNQPNRRHVSRIVMICNSRMPMGDCIWWVISSQKTVKPSPRSFGAS